MVSPLPLALTLGEPAGIGPDIALLAWQRRERAAAPSW
jgi:4-hydroxythreonine-4-phosphate dehydrogenase